MMTHDDPLVRTGERETASRIAVAASSAEATLVVLREEGAIRHRLPVSGSVTIGRSPSCDVVISGDPLISRMHAELRVDGFEIAIVDLGSSNGTRVGRRTLAPHAACALSSDDVVALGSTYMVVEPPMENTALRERPRAALAEPDAGVLEMGAIAALRPMVGRFAEGTIPVLVLGETGSGKDVVASLLHRLSPRAQRPMVCLNCAALPEALLESELFGHERGAFTGATQSKAGILESAAQGTVFLDEVGEMPLAIQAKLLRVLDRREVLRLGAVRPRSIDVRFVAATNRDLEAEVVAGRFRSDLFYRLAAASVVVPPLRERVDEIDPLAHAFAARASRELGCPVPRFTAAALLRLERHPWPGNIRELKNAVERAVLLTRGDPIDVAHLPLRTTSGALHLVGAETARPGDDAARRAATSTASAADEKARILDVLSRCHGNQTHAAEVLGMSRRTLVARLSSYGMTRRRRRDDDA
jgi:DNA-binding NtrC family response regulator